MAATGNPRFGVPQRKEREGNGNPAQRGPQQQESGGMVETVVEGASNVASTVASAAGQAWDVTRHGAQEAASTVAHAAETAWDNTFAFMRRYPMATFGAGVAAGFMLCMILQNRRD